jgi:hypothetical protein
VTSLLIDTENKDHIVYCDNFFSSPALFLNLRRKGIGACGLDCHTHLTKHPLLVCATWTGASQGLNGAGYHFAVCTLVP